MRCTAFLEAASQQNIQLVPAGITRTPFLSRTEQIWSRCRWLGGSSYVYKCSAMDVHYRTTRAPTSTELTSGGYSSDVDPVSQAAIGAAAAQSGARKTPLRTALWVGALGGMLPDLDVLIRTADDPLLSLDYHRHFTHALVSIPVGGWLTAAVGRLLSRGKHSIRSLYLPATLGWATHGLLDACTSYGTFLLWPFSDVRVAWHNIGIIDPLLTLPLLAGVVVAAKMRNRLHGARSLLLGHRYSPLRCGPARACRSCLSRRRHGAGTRPEVLEVKPSIGNNILFEPSTRTVVSTGPMRSVSPGGASPRSTPASRCRYWTGTTPRPGPSPST